MEFNSGTMRPRAERRICPSCGHHRLGAKRRCPRCGKKTEARIEIPIYSYGKRKRYLTRCWTEEEAAEVLQRKEADYWRQQALGVAREIGGTLEQAADGFRQTVAGDSDNYRKQVDTAINALAAGFGWKMQVHLITTQEISDFKEDGLEVCSSSTIRTYLLVLRRFFAWMQAEGWIRLNPTLKVKLPKAGARKEHLRPEEVGPVIDACWKLCPDVAPVITLIALGGLRKAEVVNLLRANVYPDDGWLYVLPFEGDELVPPWSPKTEASSRAVPLHPLAKQALEKVQPVRCGDGELSKWAFPVTDSRRKQRLRDKRGRLHSVAGDRRSCGTSFFGKKLKEASRAAGVTRNITLHDLRRTFAVLLQEAGAPDSVIRQALGHGQRGVTEFNYLPRRDDTVAYWVNQIDVEVSALDEPKPPAPTKPVIEVVEVDQQPVTSTILPPVAGQPLAN